MVQWFNSEMFKKKEEKKKKKRKKAKELFQSLGLEFRNTFGRNKQTK
jgi:hypothetical protein